MLQQSDSIYLIWSPRTAPEILPLKKWNRNGIFSNWFLQGKFRQWGQETRIPFAHSCPNTPGCRAAFPLALTVSTDMISLPHILMLWVGDIIRITENQTQIFLYLGKRLSHYRKEQHTLVLLRKLQVHLVWGPMASEWGLRAIWVKFLKSH